MSAASSKQGLNRLGLLGLGSRSTAFYLERLNQLFNQRFGGYGTCPLTLINSNFDEINPYLPDQFDRLETVLIRYLSLFSKSSKVLIPNITLHQTVGRADLKSDYYKQILSPIAPSVEQLRHDQVKELFIFGSLHTMRSSWLPDILAKNGVEIRVLDEQTQFQLDHLRQQVYFARETQADVAFYKKLTETFSRDAPILIACTELSILSPVESPSIYDMATLQVRAGFESLYPSA